MLYELFGIGTPPPTREPLHWHAEEIAVETTASPLPDIGLTQSATSFFETLTASSKSPASQVITFTFATELDSKDAGRKSDQYVPFPMLGSVYSGTPADSATTSDDPLNSFQWSQKLVKNVASALQEPEERFQLLKTYKVDKQKSCAVIKISEGGIRGADQLASDMILQCKDPESPFRRIPTSSRIINAEEHVQDSSTYSLQDALDSLLNPFPSLQTEGKASDVPLLFPTGPVSWYYSTNSNLSKEGTEAGKIDAPLQPEQKAVSDSESSDSSDSSDSSTPNKKRKPKRMKKKKSPLDDAWSDTSAVELMASKEAIGCLKAIHNDGWEIFVATVGSPNVGQRCLRGLARCGLLKDDKGAIHEDKIYFCRGEQDKTEIVAYLGAFVMNIDSNWDSVINVSKVAPQCTASALLNARPEDVEKSSKYRSELQLKEEEIRKAVDQLGRDLLSLRTEQDRFARFGYMPYSYECKDLLPPPVTTKVKEQAPSSKPLSVTAEKPPTADDLTIYNMRLAECKQSCVTLEVHFVVFKAPTFVVEEGEDPECWPDICGILGISREVAATYVENEAKNSAFEVAKDEKKKKKKSRAALFAVGLGNTKPFYPIAIRSGLDEEEDFDVPQEKKLAWQKLSRSHFSRQHVDKLFGVGIKISIQKNGKPRLTVDRTATITDVTFGGPAFRSGIRAGDIIMSLNGIRMQDIKDWDEYIEGRSGSSVLLQVGKQGGTLFRDIHWIWLRRQPTPFEFGVTKGRIIIDLKSVLDPEKQVTKRDNKSWFGWKNKEADDESNKKGEFAKTINRRSTVQAPVIITKGDSEWGITLTYPEYRPDPGELRLDLAAILRTSADRIAVVGVKSRCEPLSVAIAKGSHVLSTGHVHHVTLQRRMFDGSGVPRLGIGIGLDSITGMYYVKHLQVGSVADECGQIFVDDILEAYDGKELAGLNYAIVAELFSSSSTVPCTLRIQRGNLAKDAAMSMANQSENAEINDANHKGPWYAFVNILHDLDTIDHRSPLFLAESLQKQLEIDISPLKWAKSTKAISNMKIEALHSKILIDSYGKPVLPPSLDSGLGRVSSVYSQMSPRNSKTKEKSIATPLDLHAYQLLLEGQKRVDNVNLRDTAAVVYFKINKDVGEDVEEIYEGIRTEIATLLYLHPESITVELGTEFRTFRILILPLKSSNHLKGRQHLLAAQLVAWILKCAESLQKAATLPKELRKSLLKYSHLSSASDAHMEIIEDASPDAFAQNDDTAVWVQDSTLAVAWQQIHKVNPSMKYWVNHKDKLISFTHPEYLIPFPGHIEQFVDDHRQIMYRNTRTGIVSPLHPATPTVVSGIFVDGKTIPCMLLREWIFSNGWRSIKTRLLDKQKWAYDAFSYEVDGHYDKIIDKIDKSKIAEWCFKVGYQDLHKLFKKKSYVQFSIPKLEPPREDEVFPCINQEVVEDLITFYPPSHYMIYRAIGSDQETDGIGCFDGILSLNKKHDETLDASVKSLLYLPHGYDSLIFASKTDDNTIKFDIVYMTESTNTDPKYGRIFTLKDERPYESRAEFYKAMESGNFNSFSDLPSYVQDNSRYEVRVNPTAEHPTSRREGKDNENPKTKTTEPDAFSAALHARHVVCIARTVPLKMPDGKDTFGIGVDVEELSIGKYIISAISGECSAETKAALVVGDRVTAIDGQTIDAEMLTILLMNIKGPTPFGRGHKGIVQSLLHGPEGSLLTMMVRRDRSTPVIVFEDKARTKVAHFNV